MSQLIPESFQVILLNNFFIKKTFIISASTLLVATLSSPSVMSMHESGDYAPKGVPKNTPQQSVSFYENLMESGQYEYAFELLKSAHKRGVLDLDTTLFWGEMLADDGKIEKAITLFRKVAKKNIPYAIKRLEELEQEYLKIVLQEKENGIKEKVWED